MNKRGHARTLVASHPGNTNAAKKGVYSARMLAARVAELEGEIESATAAQVRRDVARRDLAGLMALVEALDAALTEGIVGARGEVKELVRMRLRASTVLRAAVLEYDSSAASVELTQGAELANADQECPPGDLLTELAEEFGVAAIGEIEPVAFGAEIFLDVIAGSADPTVRAADRKRANSLLLKARRNRASLCGCRDARRARDALEFERWVEEFRERVALSPADPDLASIIRYLAGGGSYERAYVFERTADALECLTEYELTRVRGDAVHEGGAAEEREDRRLQTVGSDPVIKRFWRTMVSPNTLPAKDRLEAYIELERAGALRKCVCPDTDSPFEEVQSDATDAFIIRSFVRPTRLGAQMRVAFPESYVAVRQMLDNKILSEKGIKTARPDADDDTPTVQSGS